MLFTFASLHEFVITLGLPRGSILGSEHYLDFSKGFATVVNGFSIIFLIAIPTLLIHWIYEILHTFFVVTVQFAAFFAIVF